MPNTNAYILSNIRNLKDNIIYTTRKKLLDKWNPYYPYFIVICGIEPHTNAYLAGYEPDWPSLDYHTMS